MRLIPRALPVLVVALVCGACASPGLPPGGPVDTEPPVLLSVTPESGSVNVRASSVLLRFDEVVNERSTPAAGRTTTGATAGATGGRAGSVGGSQGGGLGGGGFSGGSFGSGGSGLAALVLVSPGDGRERVTWRRHAIEIEPRGGFRANTTYRITLLPGLGDLRGNILSETHELVFSTGPEIPSGEISGAIFDWAAGRVAPNARIEVFTATDTTMRWNARADSVGRFIVRDLSPGTYSLRGWLDANSNRVIDPREPYDSATITLATKAASDLYAFVHDTIGPRIETVEVIDSTALRVRFDRGLDVTWVPEPSALTLTGADSLPITIGVMMPATVFDSLRRAASAARDSTAPRPDSVPRRAAPADSSTIRPPPFGRPIPIESWVSPLLAPLAPGEYRLKAIGLRALAGGTRDSERTFRVREAPPAAPPDSTPNPPRR